MCAGVSKLTEDPDEAIVKAAYEDIVAGVVGQRAALVAHRVELVQLIVRVHVPHAHSPIQ